MLMPGNIAIEPFCRPCRFEPAYLAGIRQEIEVAVYRAEADAGQALTNDAVQFIRCGVCFDILVCGCTIANSKYLINITI